MALLVFCTAQLKYRTKEKKKQTNRHASEWELLF